MRKLPYDIETAKQSVREAVARVELRFRKNLHKYFPFVSGWDISGYPVDSSASEKRDWLFDAVEEHKGEFPKAYKPMTEEGDDDDEKSEDHSESDGAQDQSSESEDGGDEKALIVPGKMRYSVEEASEIIENTIARTIRAAASVPEVLPFTSSWCFDDYPLEKYGKNAADRKKWLQKHLKKNAVDGYVTVTQVDDVTVPKLEQPRYHHVIEVLEPVDNWTYRGVTENCRQNVANAGWLDIRFCNDVLKNFRFCKGLSAEVLQNMGFPKGDTPSVRKNTTSRLKIGMF